MGGLGLKRLALWNRCLLSTHIWDILRRRNSLWVSWIYGHRLRGVGFWKVQPNVSSTWIWRKILQLREQFRPFFLHVIGDGSSTNAWEDQWLSVGHLSRFFSYRFIHDLDLFPTSTVSDVLATIQNDWPETWIQRCSDLRTIIVPTISVGTNDQVMWLNRRHQPARFTMSEVWDTLDGPYERVPWYDLCWFTKHIPKHAFCVWLAFQGRLPTQDRMQAWRTDAAMLTCPLCSIGMDSHPHLFFECPYSLQVWNSIKLAMQLLLIPNRWDHILIDIQNGRNRISTLRQKLLFSATIYHIWHERNARIFSNNRRPSELLVLDIQRVVGLRMKGGGPFTHFGR